jgi:hypothetical protein
MRQESQLLPFTRVIRITTRSRSVFWKKDATTTSQRNHKRQLLSHRTITLACRFELCAMGGRSTQARKAGSSLSASLSGGVTHAVFLLERSRREQRPISSGSCSSRAQFLVCSSLLHPKEDLLALWWSFIPVWRDAKHPSPAEPPLVAGYAFTHDGQRSATAQRVCANGYPGSSPRQSPNNWSPS